MKNKLLDLSKIEKKTFAEIVRLALDCNEPINVDDAKLNTMEDGSRELSFVYFKNRPSDDYGLEIVVRDDRYVYIQNPFGVKSLVKNHFKIQEILNQSQ